MRLPIVKHAMFNSTTLTYAKDQYTTEYLQLFQRH